MKYENIAGYDFTNEQITKNVQCKSMNITEEDRIKFSKLFNNNNIIIRHLKQLGCNSIEVSENFVQLWYNNIVINIEKDDNINYYIDEIQ